MALRRSVIVTRERLFGLEKHRHRIVAPVTLV
jgi:hypothetical protein